MIVMFQTGVSLPKKQQVLENIFGDGNDQFPDIFVKSKMLQPYKLYYVFLSNNLWYEKKNSRTKPCSTKSQHLNFSSVKGNKTG